MMMAASSMWAGCDPTWEPSVRVIRVVLHPVWAGGDDRDTSGAAAVGGVSLFLEGGGEVSVCGVPAAVNVDGVCRGSGWVNSISGRRMGGDVARWLLFVRGGSVSEMERIRRRSRPEVSVWMVGWKSTFFHVVVLGMSVRWMSGYAGLTVCGAWGVQ